MIVLLGFYRSGVETILAIPVRRHAAHRLFSPWGEGGPEGRMRGCAKRLACLWEPLIASHILGTSPQGEKREIAAATRFPTAPGERSAERSGYVV
jgi:hypothetical protein